jgi:hypothetical protein
MDARALRREAAKLRSTIVESEFGAVPSSIGYLESLLSRASSSEDKHLLFALILGECARADNRLAEMHFLRRQVAELSLQPVLLTSLASALVGDPASAPEALARCEEAVRLARQEDRQVRYSLTCQATIALALNDYEVLSAALRGLIEDAGRERTEDTAYEFDFVDKIDVQRIDAELLANYKTLAV